MNTVNFKAG